MKYKQLSLAQRFQIVAYVKPGKSQTEISSLIGVHRSTISREFRRNIALRGQHSVVYRGAAAYQKAWQRHHCKHKRIKLTQTIKQQIKSWLEIERLSLELITVELKCLGLESISHERIYQWIWSCKKSNKKRDKPFKKLYTYLRHGRRRRKRGNYYDNREVIAERVPINERPAIVASRSRIGDIEVNLMFGKKDGPPLLIMTDRTTLITTIDKLESKNAAAIVAVIIKKI